MRNNARYTYRVLKEIILQLILRPLHTLHVNAASKQKSFCSLLFSRHTVWLNWSCTGRSSVAQFCRCLLVLLFNILREQAELINYEAISVKCYECACVYSCLNYPAYNAHAPCYIALSVLSGCTIISPHYLTNGTIFRKKLSNTKCVFWFSLQLLYETFLIIRRTERYVINVRRSSCKVPVIRVRF